jgi:hypothetical protein
VSQLQEAPPGAPSANCEVCGTSTYNRLKRGEGHIPICDVGCERAWPRVLGLLEVNAGLTQKLRLIAHWCGADATAVRKAERRLGGGT